MSYKTVEITVEEWRALEREAKRTFRGPHYLPYYAYVTGGKSYTRLGGRIGDTVYMAFIIEEVA